MSLATIEQTNLVQVDQSAVLTAIGLNPRDPKSQAVVLVCDRYGLDPILKHVILIKEAVYITRDGLLHIAHSSGQFDGIEVVDESETQSHWTARVSVYRKDMGRPVTYSGRYSKTGSNKQFGPEMAIARAESMALRRAFAVAGLPSRDEVFDPDTAIEAHAEPADEHVIEALGERLYALTRVDRVDFANRFGPPQSLLAAQIAEAVSWVTVRETESSPGAGSASPDLEPSPPVQGPGPAEPPRGEVSHAQIKRLHTIATNAGVDETVKRVFVHAANGARSQSTTDLTKDAYELVCAQLEAAGTGTLPDDYAAMADAWVVWTEQQEQQAS